MQNAARTPTLHTLLLLSSACLLLPAGCPWLPWVDLSSLIAQATDRARAIEPNAIVFSVNGTNGAALLGTGSQTLEYTFLAVNPDGGPTTHKLTYNRMQWFTDTEPYPLLGAGYYDLRQVTLSETQARALLAQAGHGDDFWSWSLYRPLYPSSIPALYIFTYANKYVMINTATEEVTAQPLENEPPLTGIGGGTGAGTANVEFISVATDRIRRTNANAFIIWAGGTDEDQSLGTAEDTSIWNFIAIALDETSPRQWWLTYDGEWTVEELPNPPFGITFNDLNLVMPMDIAEAWDLVVAAGYNPPFSGWEVFKPLNPGVENPVYAFPIGGGFAIVDTVTGEVIVETTACVTDACYGH